MIKLQEEIRIHLESKRSERYSVFLGKLVLAEESKTIYNVDFEELKTAIDRVHDDFLSKLKDNLRSLGVLDKLSDDEKWDFVSTRSDRSLSKNISKLSKINIAIIQSYIEDYLVPMKSIRKRIEALKPYIVKGRKPDPNKKPAFVAPASSFQDLGLIKEIYTELLNDWRPKQIDIYVKSFTHISEELLAATANGESEEWIRENKEYGFLLKNRKLSDDYEDRILKQAEEEVRDSQEHFISKNMTKVTSVVSLKGNLKNAKPLSVQMDSGNITGEIEILFLDGSGFVVRNQVVTVWESRKPFLRYPTTFHNIKLANGEQHKKQSEEWMNTVFVGKVD